MVSRNRKIARRIGKAVANDVLDISGAISAGAGVTVYATADDLPITGLTAGDEAFVSGSNRLYISNGTGWYSIGLVNTNPAITSVEDPSTNTTPFTLATDGSALVLTITAADPEGFPLTYNYSVTSGSLTNGGGTTATVGQGTGEGYAISSASILSGTHTVNANVGALTFKPDGTEMYYVGTHNDRVSRHTLSTPWDVSTASFVGSSPNTLTQVSQLTDVKFNNDGTKMYMADKAGTTDNTIYQYSLSSAWDPGTATYDNKSYDFTTQLTSDELNCFVFNNDGSAVYLAELGPSRDIFQYTLSTPFDISTASYANKSLSLTSVASNGYIGRQYFQFTNDGSKLFLIHTFHPAGFVGKIYEYSLTTAYDISTASHTSVTYTPAGITTGRSAIAFKPDGSRMFIMGTDNHTTISQFNLPIYSDNQFTITPTTTEAYAGTFDLTFTTSDGINQASSVNSFTLNFITIIANSNYTTLLATATGTSDNNNITDTSTNNHSITVNGDAHAGTFSPYRSGGYSTYFDGTTNTYLYVSSSSGGVAIGSGDFTISFWVYSDDVTSNSNYLLDYRPLNFNTGNHPVIYIQTDGTFRYKIAGTEVITGNTAISSKQWAYFCLARDNGTTKMYVNGTLQSATYSGTESLTNGSNRPVIGTGAYNISPMFNGYISDLRVVTSLDTTAYSVPTERMSAINNTQLLTCHLPYITDGSTNNHSITAGGNGNTTTKPFSPYDYTEYSATDHGGSVYFDGSGDYLQAANPLSLSGDFTVSAWVYPEGASKVQVIASPDISPNNQFFIDANNSMGTYDGNSTHNAQGFGVKRNDWNYLVWSRSGSSLNMYLNGEQSSNSPSSTNTYNLQHIGILRTSNDPIQGYISDLQVKTTSTSAANAVPPTSPLSSSGAALHIKGTDASIIDKSQSSNLKMFGNTTGSATQVKFGGSKSMYFDGTGDYLLTSTPALGTGDWTIEGWVYFNSIPTQYIFDFRLGTNTNPALAIAPDWVYISDNNQHIQSGATPSINTWYHFAIVKNSGTTTLYIDGSSIGTFSDSLNYLGNSESTVGNYNAGGNYYLNGYLEDFRVTKGLARYTANFTPPTASLEG